MNEHRRDFLKQGLALSAMGLTGVAAAEDLNEEVRREMARRISFLVPPDGAAPDLVLRPSPCIVPFKTPMFVPRVAEPLIDLTADGIFESWETDSTEPPVSLMAALNAQKVFELGNVAEAVFSQAWQSPMDDHTTFSERRRVDIPHMIHAGLLSRETAERMGPKNQRYLILFYLLFRFRTQELMKAGIDLGGFPLADAHQRFFDFKPMKFYALWEVEFPWVFHDHDFADGDVCAPPLAVDPDDVRSGKKWPHERPVNWKRGSWTWGFGQLVRLNDDGSDKWPVPHLSKKATPLVRPGVDPNKLKALGYRFEASSPGPTFNAHYGEPIMVRRLNALPEMLNDDDIHQQLDAGQPGKLSQGTRSNIKFALPSTTSHLHNGHTASESDGHPNDWINSGEYWDHHYGNFPLGYDDEERLTTLWYHDHRMDSTAANVYAGLDGFYFLFDEKPEASAPQNQQLSNGDINDETDKRGWQLPSGKYDVPLIFHDLAFGDEKSHALLNPTRFASDPAFPQLVFDGFNTDGILGDRFTVNRTIQPVMNVEPRKYRFRLLNGGPSRFYELILIRSHEPPTDWSAAQRREKALPQDASADEADVVPLLVLTGDGNFQPNPIVARSLFFGVAQRVDVIVDFSGCEGQTIYLVNQLNQVNGRGPDGRINNRKDYGKKIGKPGDVAPDGEEWFFKQLGMVKFVVGSEKAVDDSKIRLKYRDTPKVDLTEVKRERRWNFDYDGGMWTVNGLTYDPNRIDAGIEQDSAEIWTFRNVGSGWSHPIHSHFTEFLVLEINGVPILQNRISEGVEPDPAGGRARLISTSDDLRRQFERLREADFKEANDWFKKSDAELLPEGLSKRVTHSLRAHQNWTTALVPSKANQFEELGTLAASLDQGINRDQLADALSKVVKCTEVCLDEDPVENGVFSSVADIIGVLRLPLYNADLRLSDRYGNPETPNGRFSGGPRRDVAILLPDWEVKVFMRWKDFLGKHVMHCHNVVHEDHAMMIRWDIVPPGHGFDTPKTAHELYGKEEGIPHIEMAPRKGHAAEDDSDSPRGR